MSTELINKLSSVLENYKNLSGDLEEVEELLAYADKNSHLVRVVLRFSAAGKTMEFPYPIQTAITQLTNRRNQIVSGMKVIEDKIESAVSDVTAAKK